MKGQPCFLAWGSHRIYGLRTLLPRPLIYFDDFDRQLGRSYELYSSPPRERYKTS